jgi:homopolymeric O-antigen transport system permease protein
VSPPAEPMTEEVPALGPPQAIRAVTPEPPDALPVTVIEPRPGWRLVDLRELWGFRELLYFLTWRDVKVRYKQTVLGVAWAVLQPLATMMVFSLFLGRVGGIADRVEHYPLFVLAGLLPWTFFSNAITSAGNSVVGNQSLVTKVYFPRLIIPLSAAGVGLVDFAIAFGLLAVVIPFYSAAPGWGVLMLPAVVLLLAVAALGVGILLAALTVAYRDFRYVIPFGVQLWMFATPSIYLPVEGVVGPVGQAVLPLNPAYGLVLNFRNCVLGGAIDWYALAVSGSVGVFLLAVGCLYFRRVERHFADII